MEPTSRAVADAVAKQAGDELSDAADRIKHCLSQLDDQQVWWRPAATMNSIGNLVLHLCGNVRQWIVSGIGGAKDTRDRPQEFSEQGPIERGELLARLDATVADARAALEGASPADLLQQRRIQGSDVTGMQAIFESVAHFRGHAQETVHITRLQLGDAYEFAFIPATPEEGAPQGQ